MKKIKLPVLETYSVTFDMHVALKEVSEKGKSHIESIDLGKQSKGHKEMEVARENGAQILYATTGIEKKCEDVISMYLFGPALGPNERRDLFVNELLQSSSLTFAFKKELARKIITKCDLLKGKNRNSLQGNLKKIMDWRNAFAHGHLVYNNKFGCSLSYFSSSPQSLKLDDDYWSTVENCFADTTKLLQEAFKKLEQSFITDAQNNSGYK